MVDVRPIVASYEQLCNLKLQDQWVRRSIEQSQASATGSLEDRVHVALLSSDFAESLQGPPGQLPQNIDQIKQTTLRGPFTLQINRVVNVGEPSRSRLKESSANANRTFKLELTDGYKTAYGFELKKIPDLLMDEAHGAKIVLKNVEVQRGLLLLTPQCCKVLGGATENARWHYQQLQQFTANTQTRNSKRQRTESKQSNIGGMDPYGTDAFAAWQGSSQTATVTGGNRLQGSSQTATVTGGSRLPSVASQGLPAVNSLQQRMGDQSPQGVTQVATNMPAQSENRRSAADYMKTMLDPGTFPFENTHAVHVQEGSSNGASHDSVTPQQQQQQQSIQSEFPDEEDELLAQLEQMEEEEAQAHSHHDGRGAAPTATASLHNSRRSATVSPSHGAVGGARQMQQEQQNPRRQEQHEQQRRRQKQHEQQPSVPVTAAAAAAAQNVANQHANFQTQPQQQQQQQSMQSEFPDEEDELLAQLEQMEEEEAQAHSHHDDRGAAPTATASLHNSRRSATVSPSHGAVGGARQMQQEQQPPSPAAAAQRVVGQHANFQPQPQQQVQQPSSDHLGSPSGSRRHSSGTNLPVSTITELRQRGWWIAVDTDQPPKVQSASAVLGTPVRLIACLTSMKKGDRPFHDGRWTFRLQLKQGNDLAEFQISDECAMQSLNSCCTAAETERCFRLWKDHKDATARDRGKMTIGTIGAKMKEAHRLSKSYGECISFTVRRAPPCAANAPPFTRLPVVEAMQLPSFGGSAG